MHISDSHPSQTRSLGRLKAMLCLLAGCGAKVVHLVCRVECQQGIGNTRVMLGNESGDLADLIGVHIPWDQTSGGDQQRKIWPSVNQARHVLEVRQSRTVRDAAQCSMQRQIPSLQVELDAPA